jgi:hypothetical protein
MTNIEILRSRCTAIASSFYPDRNVMEVALFDAKFDPTAEAIPKDVEIIKMAIRLVMGFVETSRSEGQESVSTNWDAVKANIKRVCGEYGLDPSEYMTVSSITDASNLW